MKENHACMRRGGDYTMVLQWFLEGGMVKTRGRTKPPIMCAHYKLQYKNNVIESLISSLRSSPTTIKEHNKQASFYLFTCSRVFIVISLYFMFLCFSFFIFVKHFVTLCCKRIKSYINKVYFYLSF